MKKRRPVRSVALLAGAILGLAFSTSARAGFSINEFLTINVKGPDDKDGNLSPWMTASGAH